MQDVRDAALDGMAVRVYLLRVARPAERAAEVAQLTGLSEEQLAATDTVLSSLGLLQRSAAGHWIAVAPDSAAKLLHACTELDIARAKARMDADRRQLRSLTEPYLRARAGRPPGEAVEHIRGAEHIRAATERLARSSVSTMRAWVPCGQELPKVVGTLLPRGGERPSGRGTPRILCGEKGPFGAELARYAADVTEAGGQLRCVASLPSQLLIADDTGALLPGRGDPSGMHAVLVRDPVLLRLLVSHFDYLWRQSTEFAVETDDADEQVPTGVELTVLRLFATGRTSGIIAEELGLSPRTITRVVSGLMRRLGARSRFQAGVRAVELGWLD